jgi:hypothetical protein
MNLQQMILFVDDDCCRPGMSVHGFYRIKLFFLKLAWGCFVDLHPSSTTMITWNGVIYISSLDNSVCM